MKECPSCQNKVEDNVMFCINCGYAFDTDKKEGNATEQTQNPQPVIEQSQLEQQPQMQQPQMQQPQMQQPQMQQPQLQQAPQMQPSSQVQQPQFQQVPQMQPLPQMQQPPYQQPQFQQSPYQDGLAAARNSVGNYLNAIETPSRFDGGLLQLIGWQLLGILITSVTLGIGFPWAYCFVKRWEAKHTIINGRRLDFDGTGLQLIGKWILWILLTIITFGIYGLWIGIKLRQWRVSHTHFYRY